MVYVLLPALCPSKAGHLAALVYCLRETTLPTLSLVVRVHPTFFALVLHPFFFSCGSPHFYRLQIQFFFHSNVSFSFRNYHLLYTFYLELLTSPKKINPENNHSRKKITPNVPPEADGFHPRHSLSVLRPPHRQPWRGRKVAQMQPRESWRGVRIEERSQRGHGCGGESCDPGERGPSSGGRLRVDG